MTVLNTHMLAQDADAWVKVINKSPKSCVYVSPGGCDIDPGLYGEENKGSNAVIPDVDFREYLLIEHLLKRKRPLLGICRGHQLICAAAGGKLIQDLVEAGYNKHAHGPVYLPNRSLLIEVTGVKNNKLIANSLHHQAIHPDHVPDGWFVSAWSDDGVIEAIQNPNLPVISIQWHPEMGLLCSPQRLIQQQQLMLSWLNQFTEEEDQDARHSILNSWAKVSQVNRRQPTRPGSRHIPIQKWEVGVIPPSHQLPDPNKVRKCGLGSSSREGLQSSSGDSNSE